jgi:hypothetical protein
MSTRRRFIEVPPWRLGGRWPAFKLAVFGSAAAGAVVVIALAAASSRLGWPVFLGMAVGAAAAYGVALLQRSVAGAEAFAFCYFQVGVLAATAGAYAACGAPVLAHLDLTAIHLAVIQVTSRPGCVLASCCYGRPGRWGIRYSAAHTTAGFPRHLVGVTLLPVPLLESAWLAVVTLLASARVLGGHPPGEALAIYLAGHGAGRFSLQFLRGDAPLRRLLGFPESQWVGLAAASVGGALGARGGGSLRALWIVPVAMATVLAALAARRHWEARRGRLLVHPCHALEVAAALERLGSQPRTEAGGVRVETTSIGVRLSSGAAPRGPEGLHHYALSRAVGPPLTARQAEALAHLIARMRHPGAGMELVPGRGGVFHLFLRPPAFRHWAPGSLFAR